MFVLSGHTSFLFFQEFLSYLTSILTKDSNHINTLRKTGYIHKLGIRTFSNLLTTHTIYLKRSNFTIDNQTAKPTQLRSTQLP